MKVCVIGGTRFFGIHIVKALIKAGHEVTIATRGQTQNINTEASLLTIDRTSQESISNAFKHKYFDCICDNIAYCSNDVIKLLNVADCGRYVLTSSSSVYETLLPNTLEEYFAPSAHHLIKGERTSFTYADGKRQAEAALYQLYPQLSSACIRLPYVIGANDYTKRLEWYVKKALAKQTVNINNLHCKMSFISEQEAGAFIAHIAQATFINAVNGASDGGISPNDVFNYILKKLLAYQFMMIKANALRIIVHLKIGLILKRRRHRAFALAIYLLGYIIY